MLGDVAAGPSSIIPDLPIIRPSRLLAAVPPAAGVDGLLVSALVTALLAALVVAEHLRGRTRARA